MAKEEVFLPVQMERLEIEPQKVSTPTNNDENPFVMHRSSASKRLVSTRCACSVKKSIRNTTSFKRNNSKLLKEPVLKFINTCCQYGGEGKALVSLSAINPSAQRFPAERSEHSVRSPLQTLNLDTLNVCTLVENCDDAPSSSSAFSAASFKELQNRESSVGVGAGSAGERNKGAGPSCSQQALNPPCDITIDELASYFETLVHIPKKMSSMAEMMYI